MAKDTDAIKADFESKISGYSEEGQAAAKSSWNSVLDKIKALFVAKLATMSSLKVADGVINAKMVASASQALSSSQSLQKNTLAPANKMLSSYSSPRLTSMKNSMATSGTGSDTYAASLSSVQRRNSFNQVAIRDKEERKLNENIEFIDELKF